MSPTRPKGLGLAALVLASVAAGLPATAAEGAKPVRSLLALRNEGVVRQHWDLTCGAAAIATLLNGQFGRKVTERQVAVAMLRKTSPVLVRVRLGFSLLDLKRYAASQGLDARGYSGLSLDEALAMAPLIVPLRLYGFRHFVVLRGRVGDHVLIADPAFGERSQMAWDFQADWANGIGFVLNDPSDPHPPNRMGAPARLVLAPGSQALRAEVGSNP
jgi:predicted double-glycine peptidase